MLLSRRRAIPHDWHILSHIDSAGVLISYLAMLHCYRHMAIDIENVNAYSSLAKRTETKTSVRLSDYYEHNRGLKGLFVDL